MGRTCQKSHAAWRSRLLLPLVCCTVVRFVGEFMVCFLAGPQFQRSLTVGARSKALRAAGTAESTGSDRGTVDDGDAADKTTAEQKDDRGSDPIVILGTLVSGLIGGGLVIAFFGPIVLYAYTSFTGEYLVKFE